MLNRVLIFDDDTDLLEVCSIILKSKNFEVNGCSKCNELIREVENFDPNVILMDNWIPDTGGIRATQLIKQNDKWKKVPVIFFSANNNVQELAREAGADYFLQKPFEIDELEALVLKAVEMAAVVNPA
jgi:DNA-binding response OmpR family regulator